MKKRLFQTSLMAITLGLMLSLSIMGVFGSDSSTVANATVTSDSEWRLIVNGSNNNYLNLSLNDLTAMPKSTVNAVLNCNGTFVADGNWIGVNLGFLLDTAGVDMDTPYVQFRATDNYTVTLPIEVAMRGDVIVAYERDYQPLPERLRLVVPGTNGRVWISMITSISQTNVVDPESYLPTPIVLPDPEVPMSPQQSSTSETRNQSTTPPEPRNQSTTPPVTLPSNSPPSPVHQQEPPESILPKEYSYLIVSAIIAATVAATGYLFYKRRKTPNLFSHKLSTT